MKFTRPVTPAEVSSDLRALIEEIAPSQVPLYVDVEPLPDAPSDECFALVDFMLEQQGGQAVVGWSIWEFPSLFVEGEFHCVWRRPDGRLVDVAPKKAECRRILFLPDLHRHYEGRQVSNLRRPIHIEPVLEAYLASFDAEFELMNRGERATQHGEIRLTGAEAAEFARIQEIRGSTHLSLSARFPTVGPYHPCPCGSGKKVKWCHREAANAA